MLVNSLIIPWTEETNACHCCNLQILAYFQSKRSFLSGFLVINHECIPCKASIDEGININAVKSVIFYLSSFVVFLEMNFEYISRMLWLLNFKIFGKINIELRQELIWDYGLNFLAEIWNVDLLSCSIEC